MPSRKTAPAMNAPEHSGLLVLNREIIACTLCPRLVAHCKKMGQVKRRAYLEWDYWAKPVPGFGDPDARLLILGLAPGAHGSNRTGRPFTGDGSGNFMYPILYKAGFTSQPNATHRDDGMRLLDAYITAAVRCAPPENKPSPEEIAACAPYLDREFAALVNVKVVVALGKIAFDAYLNYLKRRGELKSKAAFLFGHGETYKLPNGRTLLCSYHPSLQNTLTGKLTEKMFLDVFMKAKRLIAKASPTTAEAKEPKGGRHGNLADFFAASPLRGSKLNLTRRRDRPRKIDL
ncbi:MAG TPA: uracil-DNA glycosylase [Candidatus Angelobacter sp.]|nr:uracil-DNA glycosylase [Candidatus Angelobacter sp.]